MVVDKNLRHEQALYSNFPKLKHFKPPKGLKAIEAF
jgi:hypothetical protein